MEIIERLKARAVAGEKAEDFYIEVDTSEMLKVIEGFDSLTRQLAFEKDRSAGLQRTLDAVIAEVRGK